MSTDRPRSVARLALSGGNGSFRWTPVAGGVFAFEGSNYYGTHAAQVHAWYNVYVVTSGTITLRRADNEWIAAPGSVVLLSPFDVHEKQYAPGGGSLCGVFPVSLTERPAGMVTPDQTRAWRFRSPVVDDPRLAEHILGMFASIDSTSRTVQEWRWRGLLESLSRHAHDRGYDRQASENRAVSTVRAYLHATRGQIPSMGDMAHVAGLSRFHLSRIFRHYVGLSPYAYFEHVRLARARYLIHGGASLSRAAFTMGFSDQSHLTRQFSALLSTTPGQYARAVRAAREAGGLP